ncbi:MAG: four helix bundle protein [bacterium]|nr:four helix bundle protein [bacterium]
MRGSSDTARGFSHRDLIVWQKSLELVTSVYRFSKLFPDDERFGLTSQIRRAAVSVPSNIAEGRSRGSRKDFAQFLHIALGSLAEVETQLDIARNLSFGNALGYDKSMELLGEVRRMLLALLNKIKNKEIGQPRTSNLEPRTYSSHA